jgi:signal transduction histidine kinase
MNAIIGFTKVVLKTELTASQKEYLTAIKMSGDALILLINDILDLAKVEWLRLAAGFVAEDRVRLLSSIRLYAKPGGVAS